MAPVLSVVSDGVVIRGGLDVLLEEGLCLSGIGIDVTDNDPQAGLSALQPAKLYFCRYACSVTPLDPRYGDRDVLLVRLLVSSRLWISTYISVTGIDHDGVEFDALFSQTDGELKLFFVCRMVEVYRDGHGGRVRAKT